MDHRLILYYGEIDWNKCTIEHYENNGQIVLVLNTQAKRDVLFGFNESQFRITRTDPIEQVIAQVGPMYKSIVYSHNWAWRNAHSRGRQSMRKDLTALINGDLEDKLV